MTFAVILHISTTRARSHACGHVPCVAQNPSSQKEDRFRLDTSPPPSYRLLPDATTLRLEACQVDDPTA